jgi:hypothetical protein
MFTLWCGFCHLKEKLNHPRHLGNFETAMDAGLAYDAAAICIRGCSKAETNYMYIQQQHIPSVPEVRVG